MPTQKSHEFRKELIDYVIKIVNLTNKLPKKQANLIITNQIIRSSTSIGANYAESMYALTRADFIHCLNICKKESGETLYWLEVLLALNPGYSKEIKLLTKDAEKYLKILISSVKTAQKNNK